jgi:hypothetical protein
MNATPMMMPRHKAPIVEATSEVVYSTTTGQVRRPAHVEPNDAFLDINEAHCFVCRRHTDHFGEHDGLVEAGLALYKGGSVYRTDAWDDALVREVAQAEYAAYLAESVSA